jgi:hypothetical protein
MAVCFVAAVAAALQRVSTVENIGDGVPSQRPQSTPTQASIVPVLLAESGDAPPSVLEWHGRLEAWSALPLPATDSSVSSSLTSVALFVLRLLNTASGSCRDPSLGLSATAAALLGGPAAAASASVPSAVSSIVTTSPSLSTAGPVTSPLVRLLQAFSATARSAPALFATVGTENHPLLEQAEEDARAAVLAALVAPFELGVAQLDGLARSALKDIARGVSGLPHPVPIDLKSGGNSAAVRAGNALLPIDLDSSAAYVSASAPLSTHIIHSIHRSLPLVALQQVRGFDLVCTCLSAHPWNVRFSLQMPTDEPKAAVAVATPAASSPLSPPALGRSSSPALRRSLPSAAPTAATAPAAIAAALAEARRSASACECAFARLLLGSTAMFAACDALTRCVEIRGVAAGACMSAIALLL